MAAIVAIWVILIFIELSAAVPTITFPINSQVPPVARVGEPFSFIFSSSTFSSASPITYTLADSPEWLSVDSDSRRLFGTPEEADVAEGEIVGVPVTLVATDDSGPTNLEAMLVVSRQPTPEIKIPFDRQVPNIGVFSSPSSMLTRPATPFSFDLDSETFTHPSGQPLNYYSVMADNTPLPAWMTFNPIELSFSGTTPSSESLVQPPQTFAFRVIASDVEGFSAVSLGFDMIVGNHQLTADQTTIVLNATIEEEVLYTGLLGGIKVDGESATSEDVKIMSTPNIPSWLYVDAASWHISGTVPEDAASTNFTVALEDIYSDQLNVSVVVKVTGGERRATSLFESDIPIFTITAGEPFSLDFSPYLANPKDTDLSFKDGTAPSWVKLDSGASKVFGEPPSDLAESMTNITVEATSRDTGRSDTIPLSLHVLAVTTESETTTTVDPKPTASLASPSNGEEYAAAPVNVVLLATLLPCLGLLAIVAFILLCWWHRRRKSRDKPKRLTTRDISGPLPGSFVITSRSPGSPESVHDAGGGQLRHSSSPGSFHTASSPEPRECEVESRGSNTTDTAFTLPRPIATVRMISASTRFFSGSTGSWSSSERRSLSSGGRTIGKLRKLRRTRNQISLSHISETSLYENQPHSPFENNASFNVLRDNGSTSSFRDAVEVNIPSLNNISSVQPTPESAYTGESSQWSSEGSSSIPNSFSLTSADREALPLRAESRLGHYSPLTTLISRFAGMLPWRKKSLLGRDKGKSVLNRGTGGCDEEKQATDMFDYQPPDTFAYPKTPSLRIGPSRLVHDSTILELPPPPPLMKLPRAPTATVGAGGRPVTRRGPSYGAPGSSANNANNEGGDESYFGRIESIKDSATAPVATPGTAGVTLPVPAITMTRTQASGTSSEWEDMPERDSLGISYEDLVNNSPFHPSTTWSTPNTPAAMNRDPSQPNWVPLGNESPVIKDSWTPIKQSGTGTGGSLSVKSESLLSPGLLSPSRWPQPQGRGTSPASASASASGSVSTSVLGPGPGPGPVITRDGSSGVDVQSHAHSHRHSHKREPLADICRCASPQPRRSTTGTTLSYSVSKAGTIGSLGGGSAVMDPNAEKENLDRGKRVSRSINSNHSTGVLSSGGAGGESHTTSRAKSASVLGVSGSAGLSGSGSGFNIREGSRGSSVRVLSPPPGPHSSFGTTAATGRIPGRIHHQRGHSVAGISLASNGSSDYAVYI